MIANKPTRELVDMAREKIVVVTLDADVTTLPTHPAFEKVEREGERGLAIHYNKDRMNAGEVLAAVNAMGHGIVDVSTREADLEDVRSEEHTSELQSLMRISYAVFCLK